MSSDAKKITAALITGWLLLVVSAAGVADVLNNAQLYRQNQQTTLEMNFGCSFRYIRHELLGAGNELEIELVPVGECAQLSEEEAVFELRRPSGSSLAGINRIEMVLRNEQYFLTVRLSAPRDVSISQPAGLRKVRIRLGALASDIVRDDPQGTAFAVNLFTSASTANLIGAELQLQSKLLYTTQSQAGDDTWYHLRLGFYGSKGRAESAAEKLRDKYPDAFVVRVSDAEFATAARNRVVIKKTGEPVAVTRLGQSATGLSDARLAEMLAEARKKMQAGDYAAAIEIYARILQEGATSAAAEALEYMALAYERLGQPDKAIAEYRRYLELYPNTPGAARVRQRLEALLLASGKAGPVGRQPADADRRAKREREPEWEYYGGFSQYYRRDVNDFAGQGSEVYQSAVLSDVDFLTRRNGRRFDISTRLSLGHFYDLLSGDRGTGNDTRVYYLYADIEDNEWGIDARVGRQTQRGSGVLGRFDGLHVGWSVKEDWRLNFVAGQPVFSTSDDGNMDRSLYGVSLDISDFRDLVDISVYVNAQDVDGIENRQAIGGELRYFDDHRSLVSLLDYDVGFGQLNNVTAYGNWNFDNELSLNASFDYRRSPYLLTENALSGQPVSSIDALLQLFTEDEIRQLAEDRSTDLTTVTLGFSRPLTEKFDVNADITLADMGGTVASGGVPAQPGLGAEYYYNVSLIGSDLLKEGDASIFSLRYLDGNTASTTTLSGDLRYPLSSKTRINPRLTVAYRDSSTTGATETLFIPAVRVFYQWRRSLRLEAEAGTRLSNQDTTLGSDTSTSWFLYAGYRYNF